VNGWRRSQPKERFSVELNGAADRIELFDLSIANGEGKVCFEG
jgi:hypothetical protein